MSNTIIGFHAIEEGLKNAPGGSILYIAREMGSKTEVLENLARMNRKTVVRKIGKPELDRLAGNSDHRGALLVLPSRPQRSSAARRMTVREFCSTLNEDDGALVLILDGITDPHNLGAILRSADQFSVSRDHPKQAERSIQPDGDQNLLRGGALREPGGGLV